MRSSAIRVLSLVEKGGFADALIDGTIKREGITNRADAALLTEIVMGTLRHRLLLDGAITKYLERSFDKTDLYVRNALRVGAYQLLFLTRVPPHAALNETVEAVKRRKGPRLAGFANGVLRNILRDLGSEGLGKVYGTLPRSVRYSTPSWMVRELQKYVDASRLDDVLRVLSSAPPVYVRINPLKGDAEGLFPLLNEEGIDFTVHPAAADCMVLIDPPPLKETGFFNAGLATPQDVGSVLITRMVSRVAEGLRPRGGRLLDVCSAPGVKTSYLRALLPDWEMWATDVSEKRIEGMLGNFSRMGIRDVTVERVDFTCEAPGSLLNFFDVVFVDAPCSGLGVMRRNPEVKWRVGRNDVAACAEKAGLILKHALSCLKEGGYCLYSTCTFTEEENEEVVKAVSYEAGCVVESVREVVANIPEGMDSGLSVVTAPDLFDSDFFYLAIMKKEVA